METEVDGKELIEEGLKGIEIIGELDITRAYNIGNKILQLMKKNDTNIGEAFIVLSSLTTAMISAYKRELSKAEIEKWKKEYLIDKYGIISDNLKNVMHYTTALNAVCDGLCKRRFYGLSYDALDGVSKNLKSRFFILEKYKFKCAYCGRGTPEVELQLDHVIPKSKGGTEDINNLVPACAECNLGKSDRIIKNGNK